MKKLLVLSAMLLFAGSAFAQSTTVSGTITDASGQAWVSGTYSFVFRVAPTNPSAQYYWNGAPFSKTQTFAGALDSSGHFSQSLPSNTSITPSGSSWDLTVCPISKGNAQCFTVQSISVSGATMDLSSSVVPPAISIDLAHPAYPFVVAYKNQEITTAPIGGIYYDFTLSHYFICEGISPTGLDQAYGTCTLWVEICQDGDTTCGGTGSPEAIYQHNGSTVGQRPKFNVIDGSNVTLTMTDDNINDRVNLTIAASGGGGSGITPCSAGKTNGSNATWQLENANTLQVTSFVNSSFGGGYGWIPISSGNSTVDVCESLFMALPGSSSASHPLMAAANTFNRTVAWWGPDQGFSIETCNGLTDAGYIGYFPADAGCVGAVGRFTSFYSTTWSNTNVTTNAVCADQLSPPAVYCQDGSGNISTLAATGLTATAVNLKGTTSLLNVTLKADPSTGAYNFVFPASGGTVDYLLTTDGSGTTSWMPNNVTQQQFVTTTSTCTAAAGTYNKCNFNITWPIAWADTNAIVVCSVAGGIPQDGGLDEAYYLFVGTNISTTQTNILIQNNRGSTDATPPRVNCSGGHT